MSFNIFLERVVKQYKSIIGKKISLTEFSKNFSDLTVDLERGVRLEIATTMCDLHKDIVDSTPWDTGLAQANWQIDEAKNNNVLHSEILDIKDERHIYEMHKRMVSPAITPNPETFLKSKSLNIFNNVKYIQSLEAGSSPQSGPGKMIGDNVRKHEIELKKKLLETGLFK